MWDALNNGSPHELSAQWWWWEQPNEEWRGPKCMSRTVSRVGGEGSGLGCMTGSVREGRNQRCLEQERRTGQHGNAGVGRCCEKDQKCKTCAPLLSELWPSCKNNRDLLSIFHLELMGTKCYLANFPFHGHTLCGLLASSQFSLSLPGCMQLDVGTVTICETIWGSHE